MLQYISAISEVDPQVLEEARRVIAYIEANHKAETKILCLGMSSRRNLCIHPEVSELRNGRQVDAKCRDLIAPWVREKAKDDRDDIELCDFYEVLLFVACCIPLLVVY